MEEFNILDHVSDVVCERGSLTEEQESQMKGYNKVLFEKCFQKAALSVIISADGRIYRAELR